MRKIPDINTHIFKQPGVPWKDVSSQKNYMQTAINGDLSATALDQLQIFSVNSIAVKNDTAYMWYGANGQGDGIEDVDLIFLATKDMTDGLGIYEGWTKTGSPGDATSLIDPVPGTWIDYQLFAFTTFWDVDHWKMYVTGDDRTGATKFRSGLFTSTDGLSWTPNGANPIYENFTDFAPTGSTFFIVYKEHSTLYHALVMANEEIDVYGMTHLTSTDGVSWNEQAEDLLIATDVRGVMSYKKIGSTYYLLCTRGFDTDFHSSRGGIATHASIYSTNDFVIFSFEHDVYERLKPAEAGVGGMSMFDYNGIYYIAYSYPKYQVKHPFGGGEPFAAIRFIESNKDINTDVVNVRNFPSYLKRYYPLYEDSETQTPKELIANESPDTVTGTLSWSSPLKYCQFYGTQNIIYPEYVPADATKFATKVRVDRKLTGTHHIFSQDFTSGSRGWSMYLTLGKLEVVLYDTEDVIAKRYTTTAQIVKPSGVYDENDHVSVGFIFDSGDLKLCFGDNADQSVTKTNDVSLTSIVTGGNKVNIGRANSVNDMRSFCIFDEITEDQWLNVIDL